MPKTKVLDIAPAELYRLYLENSSQDFIKKSGLSLPTAHKYLRKAGFVLNKQRGRPQKLNFVG